MVTPPTTYLTIDRGFKVMARGRDHMRYLQTGVVTTEVNIKQKRANLVRFLRAWNRSVKFYQENRELMLPYIQKKLGVADAQLARRMYDDDAPYVSLSGTLNPDGAKEILDTGREALRIKETIPTERIFLLLPKRCDSAPATRGSRVLRVQLKHARSGFGKLNF
jgi:ABC-type nitrate/sulfonate/bicarbonate transport system substrate-binding protein